LQPSSLQRFDDRLRPGIAARRDLGNAVGGLAEVVGGEMRQRFGQIGRMRRMRGQRQRHGE
jgi:hypothetical protein